MIREMNYETQVYKTIPIKLIDRSYGSRKALRYTLNGTNQNVWIPLKHLLADGTIKPEEDIDYVFRRAQNQLNLAGITWAIPGIKRKYKGDKNNGKNQIIRRWIYFNS